MVFTTGPIENQGNQPANATNARVKILNRTGIHLLEQSDLLDLTVQEY